MTSSNEEQKAAALAEFNGTSEFEKEFRQQLKAKGPFDQDVWALQKRVRDKLAHIFFLDHDLAVRKDLEGVVWHLVHYRVIEEFRRNLKTVSNQANSKRDARGNIPAEKRRELRLLTSSFRAFLTEATGFYLAFINKLTSHYSLERVERLVLKRLEVEVPEWTGSIRMKPHDKRRYPVIDLSFASEISPFPAALDNLVLLFHKIKSIVGDVNDEKGDKEEGNPSSERDPAIGLVTKFVAMHAHVFVPEQQNSNAFMRMKDSFLPTFRALLSMRELQADVVTKFFVISSGSLYFASKDLWSKITQQQKFQSDRSGNRSKSSAAASAAASENTNKMSYAAVSKKQMVDKERFAMMIEMVQVLFDEVMKNMETAAASTTKLSKKKASRNDREPLLHHYIKPIKFVLLWLLRQLEAKSQDSVVEDGAEPAESSSTAGDFDFATFPWNLCARILTSIAARSPMSELLAEIRRSDLAIAHDHDVNSTFKSIWGVSPLMVADDVEFLGFGPLLSPVDEVAEYPLDVLTGAMMATVNSNDENSDAREIELIHMKQVVDIGFKLTKLKVR
ncbi:hypothetical protein HK102_014023 [Quaeritorhiza haematococci]|nr:hypothetical protein HK102_014023 [Quaeritorhiza haematococci]